MLKKSLLKNKLIFAILCVAVILGGCGNTPSEEDVQMITFKDSLSRPVSVRKNPKRVAALLGSFAEIWQLAGGEVCATSEDAWEDFGLVLEDCINIGGAHSPNLEMILASSPEFVIASSSTASNVKMLDALSDAGINVVYFDVDSFYDYLEMLDICTEITGRKDLYEKNGLKISGNIEEIKERIKEADIPGEKRKILLLRAYSGGVKAKGSDGTILGEMLKDLGCINIADSDKTILDNLSAESIIEKNPYHIFVVSMGDDEKAEKSLEKLMNENPVLKTLDAVKEKRFHIMERKMFNIKPNAKWDKSYEKLSEILLQK